MARGGGKWACKETSTQTDGSMWSRWFASPYDMSGATGNKIVSCSRRGGNAISVQSGVSPK